MGKESLFSWKTMDSKIFGEERGGEGRRDRFPSPFRIPSESVARFKGGEIKIHFLNPV